MIRDHTPTLSFRFARSTTFRSGPQAGEFSRAGPSRARGRQTRASKNLMKGSRPRRKEGARCGVPIFLALKAEAHAKAGHSDAALNTIGEALAISDETGERWAVAEMLRIKAGLLQATGRAAADEIEKLLVESLETGRSQQALSWQLRTACDLARLWQGPDRTEEDLTWLQSIYDQFTEGFGTADLIHAEALLEGLRPNSLEKVAKNQT